MRVITLTALILAGASPAVASSIHEIPTCEWKYGLKDVRFLPDPGPNPALPVEKFADVKDRGELSGVGYLDDQTLVVVSNEVHGNPKQSLLQVFKRHGQDFVHTGDHPIFKSADAKSCRADLEGLAIADDNIYLAPSFSLGRKKNSDKAAFDRGSMYEKCDAQKSVWKLDYEADDKKITGGQSVFDTESAINSFGILRSFLAVPDKENGIDIEGIAVAENEIYLGFRGPVLLATPQSVPMVPVIVAKLGEKSAPEIRYVTLGGFGIRDMVHLPEDEGFLLIAGPNGKSNAPFVLYKWDGKDGFAAPPAQSHVTALCQLDTGAEGVAVRQLEGRNDYELVVVYDQEGEDLKAQIGQLPRPIP